MSEHGTRARYAEGCRCADCVRAEQWVVSGFHPEGWGTEGRTPWNKGRSKYANDEERKAAKEAARYTWPSSAPERQREYRQRYRNSAKGKETARRYYQEVKKGMKRPKDPNRKPHDQVYYELHKADIKQRNYARMVEMQKDPNDERHGSVYGYNNGCRCDRCVKARSEYLNEWRRNNRLRAGCI